MKSCFRLLALGMLLMAISPAVRAQYIPSDSNLENRRAFNADRFGIFIHWGIYSLFGQGEWYLNSGLDEAEYQKAAAAFYPHNFDAKAWAAAFKDSGARYVTFTSRHHDGFSMFQTRTSDYNICQATPLARDITAELARALHKEGIALHFYYSILDWHRPDYPKGRTGRNNNIALRPDYNSYFQFMQTQVSELLSQYAPVRALWFDGYWDHDEDAVPFDWRMPEFYRYIHALAPECLIGNNHHITPLEGEDIQMFERDLPGENTAGLSGQAISRLPLEMCQTMNGMWGYKVSDQHYKTSHELIRLLVRAAGKGSNLLLNIGPQPDGSLPATALQRLHDMGTWLRTYGSSIYATEAGPLDDQPWGTTPQNDTTLFLHVLHVPAAPLSITLPQKPKAVSHMASGRALPYTYSRKTHTLTLQLPADAESPDCVVAIQTK